jgi:serine/threonine-protein kinase RIO1
MPKDAPKLPQKLDELSNMLDEAGAGFMAKLAARGLINKLGYLRATGKLAEVAEAAVDDYFTSNAAAFTIEPKFKAMAKELVEKTMAEIDRWAR